MNFIKNSIFLGLLAASVMSHAAGSARVVCNRYYPALEVTYNTGADAGTPGLLWVGVLTPDQTGGAFYSGKSNGWEPYTGGLYPFHSRYDGGFPRTIKVTLPFPGQNNTTREYIGYSVYAGNGVLTQAMRDQVRDRRDALNSVKADIVAKGMWRAEFDSDDYHTLALVMQDLQANKKYGMIYSIPFVDCNPSDGGGG